MKLVPDHSYYLSTFDEYDVFIKLNPHVGKAYLVTQDKTATSFFRGLTQHYWN